MAQRQRAVSLCGLITPRTSDRNGSPVFLHFGGFAEATSLLWQTLNTETHHRHGAEEARRFTLWAHNSEDVGTKLTTGIFYILVDSIYSTVLLQHLMFIVFKTMNVSLVSLVLFRKIALYCENMNLCNR